MTLLFSPDGRKVASGSYHNTIIREWNIATGRAEHVFKAHLNSIHSTIFEPNSDMIGRSHPFYSADETYGWVTRNGTKFLYLPLEFRPGRLAIRGRTVAIGTDEGRVTIMEFADGITQVNRQVAN